MTWTSLVDKFWPQAVTAGTATAYFLANVLFALIVLAAGLYISKFVSTYSQKIFNKIKLDERAAKYGVSEMLSKLGFGQSIAYALAFILSWVVVLLSVFYATRILGMSDIQVLLEKFLLLIPAILVSLLILVAGLLFGKFIGRIIANFSKENRLPGGVIMARAANGFVVLFASLIALENLGINMTFVNSLVLVTLASLGLAFAIAVGLGAKPLVEEFLRNILKKEE